MVGPEEGIRRVGVMQHEWRGGGNLRGSVPGWGLLLTTRRTITRRKLVLSRGHGQGNGDGKTGSVSNGQLDLDLVHVALEQGGISDGNAAIRAVVGRISSSHGPLSRLKGAHNLLAEVHSRVGTKGKENLCDVGGIQRVFTETVSTKDLMRVPYVLVTVGYI